MSEIAATEATRTNPYLSHNLFQGVALEFKSLPPDLCDRGYFQTRTEFDTEGALQELADSLRVTGGNFTPIVVRRKFTGRYEIISGERRVRAAMMAELPSLMALVGGFTDEQASIICLTENLQRKNLSPIEEAKGFARMMEHESITQKDVAELIGRSRPYVSNMLRLLKLEPYAQDLLHRGKLEIGHGKALSSLRTRAQQREWAIKCAKNQWSVRYLEDAIRKLGVVPSEDSTPYNKNADVARLENQLSETICHPCRISFNKETGGGELIIRFAGPGDFDGILERVAPSLLEVFHNHVDPYESDDS